MQKEIQVQIGRLQKIELNIIYDDRSFKPHEVKKLKEWSDYILTACHHFLFKGDLKAVTQKLKYKEVSLALSFVGDTRMRALNKMYRHKDKLTDVLSFPLQENLREGRAEVFIGKLGLGDIVISKTVCTRQAKKFKLSFYEEFAHLMVHGFLHLSGYDHEISLQEEKLMQDLEKKLIDLVSKSK